MSKSTYHARISGKMLHITAPHFVAAVELSIPVEGKDDEWLVDNAPPILRYMMGWHRASVVSYCRNKGWNVIESDEVPYDEDTID